MDKRKFTIVTAVIAVVGGLTVWVLATELFPYHSINHDEGVYLQQAAMLLNGQLNLWPPVEDVTRPWFFVEDGDRLYPKYAPVPSVIFALGRLLGGYRLALVGVAMGNLALVAGVISEVFDRRTGCLGAVFVLCSPLFLLTSSVFLPYAPTTLLNLTFAYGYLRSDRTGSRRWAAVAGVAIGLAFFARPFTAVLFGTPFIVHALWTMRSDRESVARHAWTATLGAVGVGLALAYNAVVTGSPWLFPYAAFAPLDGLGFGTRQLLTHEVEYTPQRALYANWKVIGLFATNWIAGGLLGAALAVGGVGLSLRRRSPRETVLAGLFLSVAGGNVFFWGNNNILGALDRPGDGLIAYLGPYYHFDLLVPTAAFAGVTVWAAVDFARSVDIDVDVDRRVVRTLTMVAVVVVAGGVGTVSVINADERIDRNQAVTQTYTDAYEPFDDNPQNALVLLPTPYGNWLAHPFQALRNDPGFGGSTVYTTDAHPFASVDAFEHRTIYRYVYRGAWSPASGSPDTARLQRVQEMSGDRVRLDSTLGIPDSATSVTVRIATDEAREYAVVTPDSNELTTTLTITDGHVRLDDGSQIALSGRDTITLSVFVEYGVGDGFTYRLELPVDASDDRVRALSPRIERCHGTSTCQGDVAHIPETAPNGIFVNTSLTTNDSTTRTKRLNLGWPNPSEDEAHAT